MEDQGWRIEDGLSSIQSPASCIHNHSCLFVCIRGSKENQSRWRELNPRPNIGTVVCWPLHYSDSLIDDCGLTIGGTTDLRSQLLATTNSSFVNPQSSIASLFLLVCLSIHPTGTLSLSIASEGHGTFDAHYNGVAWCLGEGAHGV